MFWRVAILYSKLRNLLEGNFITWKYTESHDSRCSLVQNAGKLVQLVRSPGGRGSRSLCLSSRVSLIWSLWLLWPVKECQWLAENCSWPFCFRLLRLSKRLNTEMRINRTTERLWLAWVFSPLKRHGSFKLSKVYNVHIYFSSSSIKYGNSMKTDHLRLRPKYMGW